MRPLDAEALERLALHYAGRYATTRAKLSAYLTRKLAERGWAGEGAPPVEAIVTRMAALRYVDDRAFAEARGAALARRGLGGRRVADALRAAGIRAEDRPAPIDEDGRWVVALAFARRRKLGPFAAVAADGDTARRAIGALIRAGHDFAVARRIVAMAPGEAEDAEP